MFSIAEIMIVSDVFVDKQTKEMTHFAIFFPQSQTTKAEVKAGCLGQKHTCGNILIGSIRLDDHRRYRPSHSKDRGTGANQ